MWVTGRSNVYINIHPPTWGSAFNELLKKRPTLWRKASQCVTQCMAKGVERKVQKQKETLKGDVRHSYEDSGSENYG